MADEGDEEVLVAAEAGAEEVGEEGVDEVEGAGAEEAEDEGVVGVVTMAETRVVLGGVVEDSEGEVEVGFAGDEGDEALWVEVVGPVWDRRGDGVGGGGEEEIDGGGGGEGDGGD